MGRLIDADALDDVVQNLNENHNAGITRNEYKQIDSVLFAFPTIDAVPVVRCKDCVSYGTSISGVPCEGYCKQLEYTTRKDDDFCSWGRRKNEAD